MEDRGFFVYQSRDLWLLFSKALDVLRSTKLKNSLEKKLVVMPSDGMARWFSLEMAKNENLGICANIEFLSPDNYLKRFAEINLGVGSELSPWDKNSLRWILFDILESLKGATFKKIRNYFGDDSSRRYLLAGKIADLFDQYFIYRTQMIESWKEGKQFYKKDSDEKWQMDLFIKAAEKIQGEDRVDIYRKFISKCKDPQSQTLKDQHILLFGISSMSRYHLDLFHALSEIIRVDLFLLSPSEEYWAYVRKKKNEDDPESNRFLGDLGKSGRVFMDMLYSIDVIQPEVLPAENKAPQTDLEKIKSDINNVDEEGAYDKKPDNSVVINGCWGKMREVEVLKDQLLEAFSDDSDLKPSDVIVMTPDIQGYAPYIRAVFDKIEGEVSIPYSIGDVSVSNEGMVIPVFLKMLHMIGTVFKKSDVLSIFEKESVYRKFRVDKKDLESIKTAVERSGIRWGVDRRFRENMDFPPYEQNSWRFGIDRMILGYSMKGEGKKIFSGVMPYDDIEGGSAVSIARFITFTEKLFKSVETFSMDRTVSDWSARLNELVDEMFEAVQENTNEIRYLRLVFESLKKSAQLSEFSGAVSWKIVLAFLEEFLTGGSYGRGFINGNVTFCSMKPMRAIPFKVVCMIGMNDDVFPGEQVKNLFDLMTKYPKPEDRNNVESNRYFFLESLISAQNRLIISYNAKSVRDSSDNLFSSPVKLLKDYLDEKKSGFKEIIQPLQPFSAKYFENNDGLFTFSESNFSIISRLAQGFKENTNVKPLEIDNEGILDIKLEDLIGFFMNPARTFFRKRLGVTFPYIQEKVEDNELFSINALDAYHFKNEYLKVVEDGGSATDFRKKMHGEGKIPHGPAGKVLLNGSVADMSGFIEKIRDHKGVGDPREIEVDNTFSVREKTIRVRGVLENVYGKWQVFFRPTKKAKQKDKLRIWLNHLFLNTVKQQDTCFLGTEEDVFLHPVSEPEPIIKDMLDIYLSGMERPLPMTPFVVFEMFDAKGDDKFAVMLEKRANPWGGETDDHAFSVASELSGFYEGRPETVKMLEDIAFRIVHNYKRHETVIK